MTKPKRPKRKPKQPKRPRAATPAFLSTMILKQGGAVQ